MKGDKKGSVHCVSCYKVLRDANRAIMDEDDNLIFLCDDCYNKLKPFYVKGASNVDRATH